MSHKDTKAVKKIRKTYTKFKSLLLLSQHKLVEPLSSPKKQKKINLIQEREPKQQAKTQTKQYMLPLIVFMIIIAMVFFYLYCCSAKQKRM